MSTRLAEDVIRLTGTPMYCSACFNQDSAVRHVDFDAASDRGYGHGSVPVAMDDLVLCETCLKEGARLLGMIDQTLFQAELDGLRKRYEFERKRADSADLYAEKLEAAVDARPNPVSAPRRVGRPPKQEGQPDAGS